ncbi:hypothetical protein GW17_00061703 [Ensete ventricosum]|nr:hypothetical protein GW17_00061703 [Ensete ventricosum]
MAQVMSYLRWTTWLSWTLSTNRRTKSTLNLLTQFDLIITGSTIESRCLTTQTATFHLSPVSPSLCLVLIKTSSSEQCRALPSATPSIPDLLVVSTHGTIQLHGFVGDGWAILFSPTRYKVNDVIFLFTADFTPVCTRELGKMAMYAEEFETRGVKPLGFSCDDVASHVEWIKDVEDYAVTISISNDRT